MSPRAVLAVLLAFPHPALAAAVPFDARATPLDGISQELLIGHGYELRGDGKVLDKIADAPVRADDMPYLLSRLASARRLKVLLELNIILNRSGSDKKLPPEDREALRSLVRQNWALFSPGTRKDFRGYFTPEELARLNQQSPRLEVPAPLPLRDPEPAAAGAAPAAAPLSLPVERPEAAPLPAPAARSGELFPAPAANAEPPQSYFRPTQVLTPFLPALSLRRPSPYVTALPPEPAPEPAETPATLDAPPPAPVRAPAPAPAPALSRRLAPAETPATLDAPPPAPGPAPAAAVLSPLAPAPALPPSPAPRPETLFAPPPGRVKVSDAALAALAQGKPVPLENPGMGVLKPWTPPSAAAAALPAAPAAAPAPDFAPPPVAAPDTKVPLAAADTSGETFAKFVASGPYGRDDRALLEFLAKKAPDFCRPLLLRTVVRTVPRIVIDGARTGFGQRSAGYLADPSASGSTPLVALSPGPILAERRRGLFGKDYAVLPESDALYAELGLPAPRLEAAKKGAPAVVEQDGLWGAVKLYPDRTRRAAYSPQQQAGDLLYELLLIGLQREGFGASTLAARTWADTARFMLYARVREELGHDAFLDPDRRVELRERLERPDETRDRQIGAWASARSGLLDPRRGSPASQLEYERAAKDSCARSALADRLYELARRREAAVRAAAALAASGFVEEAAADAAIKSAVEREASQRGAAVAMPSCPAETAGLEAALQRSAALFSEAARLERAWRDVRARKGGPADE